MILIDRFFRRYRRWRIEARPFLPFIAGFVSFLFIFCGGVTGYMLVEGWSLLDAMFMMVLTLSTVGYQTVHPLSPQGVVMTMAIILLGVGNFAYLAGAFAQALTEGRLQRFLENRRVRKTIEAMSGHVIICGYGRIGSVVCAEIRRAGLPVVVLEKEAVMAAKLIEDDVLHIIGDATADASLLAAGLERAKVIVTALSQDAANVYVSLTARQVNPSILIIARAESEAHIPRLMRAGADKALLPHVIGGLRMAQSVLRPTVTDFLDLALAGGSLELQMEELAISGRSELIGQTLLTARIRPRFNLIVVAVKRPDGHMVFNPTPETDLGEGDTLIAVGKPENLAGLRQALQPGAA